MLAGLATVFLRPSDCAWITLPCTIPEVIFYWDEDNRNRAILGRRRRDWIVCLPVTLPNKFAKMKAQMSSDWSWFWNLITTCKCTKRPVRISGAKSAQRPNLRRPNMPPAAPSLHIQEEAAVAAA